MPHVEVLPNSAASVAPGWTYVVDTGYDPSKVAINPKNKKRAAANPNQRGESELSSLQQTAIARRIAELNRDNDPKQVIPVPGKSCTHSLPASHSETQADWRCSDPQDTECAEDHTIPETDQALARR